MAHSNRTVQASRIYEAMKKSGSSDELAAMAKMRVAQNFIFDASSIPSELFWGAHDFADQLAQFNLLRLPYDNVTFQILTYDDSLKDWTHHVILAWHEGDDIVGRNYVAFKEGCNSARATFRIPKGLKRKDWVETDDSSFLKIDDDPVIGRGGKQGMTDEEANQISKSIFAAILYCAIGCLSAEGIDQQETPEPRWINANRERKGRAPVFGHRLVSVDISAVKMPGLANANGSHSSPRLHWRRGHVRRLLSGRIVMVRPCLVGDPTTRMIEKDYIIRSSSSVVH